MKINTTQFTGVFGWLKNNKATEKSALCIKLNGNNKNDLGWTVFHISTNQLSTQTASIEFHVKTDREFSSAFNEFQITWFPIEIIQSLNIVEFDTDQAKKKDSVRFRLWICVIKQCKLCWWAREIFANKIDIHWK